jgi:hypothetical protein
MEIPEQSSSQNKPIHRVLAKLIFTLKTPDHSMRAQRLRREMIAPLNQT